MRQAWSMSSVEDEEKYLLKFNRVIYELLKFYAIRKKLL